MHLNQPRVERIEHEHIKQIQWRERNAIQTEGGREPDLVRGLLQHPRRHLNLRQSRLWECEGVSVIHLHERGHMELLVPAGNYSLLYLVHLPIHRLLWVRIEDVTNRVKNYHSFSCLASRTIHIADRNSNLCCSFQGVFDTSVTIVCIFVMFCLLLLSLLLQSFLNK